MEVDHMHLLHLTREALRRNRLEEVNTLINGENGVLSRCPQDKHVRKLVACELDLLASKKIISLGIHPVWIAVGLFKYAPKKASIKTLTKIIESHFQKSFEDFERHKIVVYVKSGEIKVNLDVYSTNQTVEELLSKELVIRYQGSCMTDREKLDEIRELGRILKNVSYWKPYLFNNKWYEFSCKSFYFSHHYPRPHTPTAIYL